LSCAPVMSETQLEADSAASEANVDVDAVASAILELSVDQGDVEIGLPHSVEPTSVVPTPSRCDNSDKAVTVASVIDELESLSGRGTAVRVFFVPLPVRVGGAGLALCAGMVNAISALGLGTYVSHLTGTWSRLGLGLEDAHRDDMQVSACLVLSFLLGSTMCGLVISKGTVHFGLALYDFGLIGTSSLLVLATIFSDAHEGKYFASAACGLQNGMATHWGGAVVRTTHVTGLFTDVGLLIGRILSLLCRKRCGRRFDPVDRMEVADDLSKLSVLGTLGLAFLAGICLGASLYRIMDTNAFLVPASAVGSAGVAYSIYRVFVLHQHFFSDEEMEIVDLPLAYMDAPEEAWAATGGAASTGNHHVQSGTRQPHAFEPECHGTV